jgi:hypothetical protein
MSPARQTAHIAAPAANDKSRELTNDFQVKVFKFGLSGTSGEYEGGKAEQIIQR